MLQWLKGKRAPEAGGKEKPALSEALACAAIAWREDANLPIPDWSLQAWPESGDDAALHGHANALAAGWLDAMGAALSGAYGRLESANFMLLSTMQPRAAGVLLDYLERSLRRVLATLPSVASNQGHGKTVVIVFGDEDGYYRYIANDGSDSSQPEAFSGGMFIDAGYGHFVFAQGPFETMEPVVVHELTHCPRGWRSWRPSSWVLAPGSPSRRPGPRARKKASSEGYQGANP